MIRYLYVFIIQLNPNLKKKGNVYKLNQTYSGINNILYDLSKIDTNIPDNIKYYETLYFDSNNSKLCIESYNEDIQEYVQITMTLYAVAHFLSLQEVKRLGISPYGANK